MKRAKNFFTNLYAYFIQSKQKSDTWFNEVINTDPILVLLESISSKALRFGFILYFCNRFLFFEDVIVGAGALQVLGFSISITCSFLYLIYFFSSKRFWHFNSHTGVMIWGAAKAGAKHGLKVLGGGFGLSVAVDQTLWLNDKIFAQRRIW